MANRRSILDRFEKDLILPIARGAPLLLAGLAFALLAMATVVLIISLVPPRRPAEPQPAEAPPVVALDIDAVEAYIAEQERTKESTEKAAPAASDGSAAPEPSADAVALAREIHSTRVVLEEKGVAWETRYRTECVERLFGVCFQTRRRVVTQGLGDRLFGVLSLHDEGDTKETVQLEPENVTYTVNPSNAKTKTTLLQELRTVLSAGSTREPRALAIAWLELRERHDRERNELIRKEADRVALERAAAQARHEAALAERRERLNAALKALGAGLGALVVLGLSLAILSIERNTRALLYRDPSGARVS